MGNRTSSRRRRSHHQPAAVVDAAHVASTNEFVVAAPSDQYPLAYNHSYPCAAAPAALMEQQKAVTIRNYVNVRKGSIRVEEDEEHPGMFLVAFTFDAETSGSITVLFFAKEGVDDCNLIATKEDLLKPVTVSFQQGYDQKFRQPSGTGIDFSMFEEKLLRTEDEERVYPLVVKAEVCPINNDGSEASMSGNFQITLAVFDKKDKGEHLVRVLKQFIWVNNMRYELHEIYGIGNSMDIESDGNNSGKECVICMSEPQNTTVLPCRHMCMCSGCAKALKMQTNRCPICRQPVESFLEIEVNNGADK